MIQNDALSSQQNNVAIQEEGAVDDQTRLQEALYVQEAQLNQVREVKNSLEATILTQKQEREQLQSRLKQAEDKAKKYNEAVNEAKRKQKIIQDKNNMIDMLQDQLSQAKQKAVNSEKYYQQNRELVTRKCALESAVTAKDKQIQELQDKLNKLELKTATPSVMKGPSNHSTFSKTGELKPIENRQRGHSGTAKPRAREINDVKFVESKPS